MKSMGIEKVRYFDPQALRRVAAEHLTFMYKRVTGGMDADGKKFPDYTKEYAELKKSGFKRTAAKTKTGKLKKTQPRGKTFRNVGLSRQINPPDFRLTGLTMKNLRDRGARKVGRDFYEIGWDGIHAAIVEGQASKGRDIMSNLPDKEFQYILGRLGVEVDKEWQKKIKSTVITIGK